MISKAARMNLEAHIWGERSRDIEALMAPLSDHPRYVIPHFILEGRDAVRAMYEMALPLLSEELSDEYLRALDDPRVTTWGDAHGVIEYSDSYPLHRDMVVVVHFHHDRLMSENTYFTHARRYQLPPSDHRFDGVPGVLRVD